MIWIPQMWYYIVKDVVKRSKIVFRELSVLEQILIQLIGMGAWSLVCFVLCVKIPVSYFDEKKKRYQPLPFERNGKWYSDKLRINKWKDLLPQHIGKDGFSKERLTSLSVEYLDDFILETCRGEWDHSGCCLYAIIAVLLTPTPIGILFALLTLLINLPFFAIQRYNRFRLQILKKRLVR